MSYIKIKLKVTTYQMVFSSVSRSIVIQCDVMTASLKQPQRKHNSEQEKKNKKTRIQEVNDYMISILHCTMYIYIYNLKRFI